VRSNVSGDLTEHNAKKIVIKLFFFIVIWVTYVLPQPPIDSLAKTQLYPIDEIPVGDSIKIPVLDFKNTDIKDILRGLGIQYNVNIFVDPDVSGLVSLYLVDVTVRNAIDFIIKLNNCAYTVDNSIVRVYMYQAPPPSPPKPKVEFHLESDLLSIDVKEIQAGEIARMFGDSAHVNVIVNGTADKLISARLIDIQPEKAVKALFESNGFEITLSDGIYYATVKSWGNGGADQNALNAQFRPLSLSIQDKLVTLEVDNASLDQLVRNLSVQSGINIVIYDQLTGDITARLSAVPLDDALRFLLQNTRFTFWKEKGIYFIGSREMNQQKTTVIIPLKHIRADEGTIAKMLPPLVTASAVIKYNTEHNSVIVIGSFDVVTAAEEFIKKIDTPIPQVLVEALVVDFNVNKINTYGFSLFTSGLGDSSNKSGNSYLPKVDLTTGSATSEKVLSKMAEKMATVDILKKVMDYFGASQIVNLPENFKASIRALETADIAKVHSTPQIATINGNPASITIGETRYYKLQKETVSSSTATGTVIGNDERFEVLKFNTQLEITPWVMDDGYVMVKIRPEFNIPRTSSDSKIPPNVDTRVIESMVRLRNGQTIVLGGQRQSENIVNRSGVPFLSRIPVLGWLFSSRTITKVETQMMIFLTPHVYYGDENSVKPDEYFGKEINKVLYKYGFKEDKKTGEHGLDSSVVEIDTLKQYTIKKEIIRDTINVKKTSINVSSPDSVQRIDNTKIGVKKAKKKRLVKCFNWP
jgi:type II secretory pathway component GspD/PulD (secretin)